ncbi:hypothetical protein FQZ97_976940 [compost metagenome]
MAEGRRGQAGQAEGAEGEHPVAQAGPYPQIVATVGEAGELVLEGEFLFAGDAGVRRIEHRVGDAGGAEGRVRVQAFLQQYARHVAEAEVRQADAVQGAQAHGSWDFSCCRAYRT